MQFDIDVATFHRLPRHPDWVYELWDGRRAHLRHRPQPLRLWRSTSWEKPTPRPSGYSTEIAGDKTTAREVVEFLSRIWRDLDPYCSFDDVDDRLEADLRTDLASSLFAVVTTGDQGVAGAVIVSPDHRTGGPFLSWLAVESAAREQGVATSLLEAACAKARGQDATTLTSAVSAANPVSLRWHLGRGFQLESLKN